MSLGNRDRVPVPSGFGARSLDVVDFVGARTSELRALRTAVASVSGNRRVYQQLSWHQRRRTMSHTSYRMPARLRAAHRRELSQAAGPDAARAPDGSLVEKQPGPQGKMRCRKYRRRAGFLLALRRLRSQNPRWLETHIWHAKRFRMEEIPGGRIVAMSPNDRGLRSGYRAVAHTSLLHDASYLDVVEVTAPSHHVVLSAFERCMSVEDAARSSVDPVVAGTRRVERVVILNEDGRAVAPVNLLWRPGWSRGGPPCEAQLWIWCHPVTSQSVVSVLSAGLDGGGNRGGGCQKGVISVSVLQPPNGVLTLSIIGPRAGAVLAAVLHRVRNGDGAEWECLRQIRSAASLPRGCVLALDVEDPRASYPPKRTGAGGNLRKADGDVLATLTDGFQNVMDSGLWSEESRSAACRNGHHKDGAPWTDVPVICMQRTSAAQDAERSGFASGWDIVVPTGWGMAFWISLVYANGGRAAGQRELRHIALETGVSAFPDDYQDTEGGRAGMEWLEQRAAERHAKRPPAKRVNYGKYRIASPFRVDLDALVEVFREDSNATRTRRPKKRHRSSRAEDTIPLKPTVVRSLHSICDVLRLSPAPTRRQIAPTALPRSVGEASNESQLSSPSPNLLFHVILRPNGRGVPRRNAVIVLPTLAELASFAESARCPQGPVENRKSEPRPVVGAVLHGDYALSEGGSVASAVVSARALVQAGCVSRKETGLALKKCGEPRPIWLSRVLFRNVDSLQYRWAIAEVVAH